MTSIIFRSVLKMITSLHTAAVWFRGKVILVSRYSHAGVTGSIRGQAGWKEKTVYVNPYNGVAVVDPFRKQRQSPEYNNTKNIRNRQHKSGGLSAAF